VPPSDAALDPAAAAAQPARMADTSGLTLTITFSPAEMEAIDDWIARHDDPKPSREDAVCQLVIGRLGAEDNHPSTVLPGFTTGRDIV
jgi:hypothetical protein